MTKWHKFISAAVMGIRGKLIFGNLITQSIKYSIVGGGLYIFDLAIFSIIVLIYPGLYLLANVVGRIIGAVAGFFLHRNWTFNGEQKRNFSAQIFLYTGLLFLNILASSVLLTGLVKYAELMEISARIVVDLIIITSTFIFSKLIIFRENDVSKTP